MGRAVVVLTAALVGILPVAIASRQQTTSTAQAQANSGDEASVRAVCGVCHALPPPDVLPRAAWRDEFVRMMFIRENRLPPVGRGTPQVELPPDMQAVLSYYLSRAPERLPAPEPWPAASESPLRFTRRSMTMTE